jgi:F0F1-type ATP synthase epsilon subunit
METQYFTLEIISTVHTDVHSVMWVEIESPTGSFLVGPDHSPLISIIKTRSIITYKKANGEEDTLDASGGIFKVANNKATILLDH